MATVPDRVPRHGATSSTRGGRSEGDLPIVSPAPPVIRTLVVDLDGVLRHWRLRPLAVIEQQHGLPAGSMAAVAFDGGRLLPAVTGRISDEQWRAGIAEEMAARFGPAGARAVQAWSPDCGELDPEVLELVARQRRDRRVAILTNATSRLRTDLAVLGLLDRVDAVFSSAELGVAKPDPVVFERVCAYLGVEPAACAFVDDAPANVATAAHLGMRAHHYRTPVGLAAFLVDLPGRARR